MADWNAGFRPIAAAHLGVEEEDLPRPDSWEMSEWGLEAEDLRVLFKRSIEERIFRDLPAYEGASEVLRGLSDDGVHIRIVTHRLALPGSHAVTVSDTVAWLDENRIPYWDLCFLGRKSDLDLDLLIDDAPHNIESLRQAGRNILVMDQAYNRHLGGPRATSWREVDAHVRRLL